MGLRSLQDPVPRRHGTKKDNSGENGQIVWTAWRVRFLSSRDVGCPGPGRGRGRDGNMALHEGGSSGAGAGALTRA